MATCLSNFFICKGDILSLFWFLNMIWITYVIFGLSSFYIEKHCLSSTTFISQLTICGKNIVEEVKFIFTGKAWGHTNKKTGMKCLTGPWIIDLAAAWQILIRDWVFCLPLFSQREGHILRGHQPGHQNSDMQSTMLSWYRVVLFHQGKILDFFTIQQI